MSVGDADVRQVCLSMPLRIVLHGKELRQFPNWFLATSWRSSFLNPEFVGQVRRPISRACFQQCAMGAPDSFSERISSYLLGVERIYRGELGLAYTSPFGRPYQVRHSRPRSQFWADGRQTGIYAVTVERIIHPTPTAQQRISCAGRPRSHTARNQVRQSHSAETSRFHISGRLAAVSGFLELPHS